MRAGFFLFLMLWATAATAQTMYKCVDERKQVTYSNITCEKQGLKDAGTVTADRVTTMPSGPAPLPTQKLKPPVEMPKDLEKNAK
jgi:hypothetical protein